MCIRDRRDSLWWSHASQHVRPAADPPAVIGSTRRGDCGVVGRRFASGTMLPVRAEARPVIGTARWRAGMTPAAEGTIVAVAPHHSVPDRRPYVRAASRFDDPVHGRPWAGPQSAVGASSTPLARPGLGGVGGCREQVVVTVAARAGAQPGFGGVWGPREQGGVAAPAV